MPGFNAIGSDAVGSSGSAALARVQRTFAIAFAVMAPPTNTKVQRTFSLAFVVQAARTKVQRTFALSFAVNNGGDPDMSDFVPSAVRTIRAQPGGLPSKGDVAFWSMANASMPTGVMDPDSVIDVTMDWTAVLDDITSEIATADIQVVNAQAGASFTEGAKTTVFISNPTGVMVQVRFRITSKGTPARTEDRTVALKVVSQ